LGVAYSVTAPRWPWRARPPSVRRRLTGRGGWSTRWWRGVPAATPPRRRRAARATVTRPPLALW